MELTKALLKIRYLYLLELKERGYNYIMRVGDDWNEDDHIVYEKSFVNHPDFDNDYDIPYEEIGKYYENDFYDLVKFKLLPDCVNAEGEEWELTKLIEDAVREMNKFEKKEVF